MAAWAQRQPIRSPQASFDQIGRHLDFLHAALPSRRSDEQAGRMRATVYAAVLSGYSDAALGWMAQRACATLDWFPTPHQCLEILQDWREPVTARARADALCLTYWQGQYEAFAAALADGTATAADVARAKPRWCAIACERGLLRRLDDGSYVIRTLWQGPLRQRPMEAEGEEQRAAA